MTAGQDYFERVLALGHPPEHALAYTLQHYPDFVPDVPASMASPQPTLDVEEGEQSPTKAYAAAALLLIGALFCVTAQFNHEWIVINEDDSLGLSAGLTTIRADCSEAKAYNGNTQANATEQCKAIAYVWFADDMDAAAAENKSVDDLNGVFVNSHANYCNNVNTLWNNASLIIFSGSSGGDWGPLQFALASSVRMCNNVGNYADPPASKEGLPTLDESKTSFVLWLGSIIALLGTGLSATAAAGRELPGNIERHGKWAGFGAGVIIIAALLLFGADTSPHLFGTSMGMGPYMALLGGVLAIVAGVLTLREQK